MDRGKKKSINTLTSDRGNGEKINSLIVKDRVSQTK